MRRPIRDLALLLLLTAAPLLAQGAAQAPAPNLPPPLPEGVPAFQVAQHNSFTWYGRFGQTNCAWIELGDAVAVIDSGWTAIDAANLAAKVKETTKGKPIKWYVMTHVHTDSNGGFEAFLPTDATLVLNGRIAAYYARGLAMREGGKVPAILGVSDRVVIASGGRRLELIALPGSAHSEFDLIVSSPEGGIVFVGDLVTPGRCPLLYDIGSDPKGWLGALDKIEAFAPGELVGTRGDPTTLVANEVEATRQYIKRVQSIVSSVKAKNQGEARVASELALAKVGGYCPPQLDSTNALAIFRRTGEDGNLTMPSNPTSPETPPAPKPTPSPLKKGESQKEG